jgi:hypothetical protein
MRLLAKERLAPEMVTDAMPISRMIELLKLVTRYVSEFFSESLDRAVQQDLVGELCVHIGIGSQSSQLTAARALSQVSDVHADILSGSVPLIDGLLYAFESLSLHAFKLVIETLGSVTLCS